MMDGYQWEVYIHSQEVATTAEQTPAEEVECLKLHIFPVTSKLLEFKFRLIRDWIDSMPVMQRAYVREAGMRTDKYSVHLPTSRPIYI